MNKGRLFWKIGEVAKMLGEPEHVLRYWETEFPTLRPRRHEATGARMYQRKDIDAARKIAGLLRGEGYTIAGARRAMKRQRKERANV